MKKMIIHLFHALYFNIRSNMVKGEKLWQATNHVFQEVIRFH